MIVICPTCGRRNRVPGAASGVPRCGNCRSPLPWTAEADDESFAEVVEQSTLPVLLDVWATWCGPCRAVSPVLEQLAQQHAGRVKLVKMEADRAPVTSLRFGVHAIPTLLLLRDGREYARQVGAAGADRLGQWLNSSLTAIGGDTSSASGRPA